MSEKTPEQRYEEIAKQRLAEVLATQEVHRRMLAGEATPQEVEIVRQFTGDASVQRDRAWAPDEY
ncbi:hypothetical protein [Actinopolymorpha rutila]|jgi:predicted negative regulator of RcsB-dependent stress response|uniref:Putative negative regulator of RcsB-dependent stress response n=1 Tax=Actinopolymorpha rutila TaxID=446787 RepID=A0A852ZIS7_9ACTN|nr:hypothetical protein [Actinopolymorpha rutila]NYH88226.1 putative negative regulator of RcsB-dependent stress response [Actinopolymorpha rutila]